MMNTYKIVFVKGLATKKAVVTGTGPEVLKAFKKANPEAVIISIDII